MTAALWMQTRRAQLVAAGLATVALVAGCDGDEPAGPAAAPVPGAAPPAPAPLTVTRDDPSYPARCRPQAQARSIERFLTLQSRGEAAAAAEYVEFEQVPAGAGAYADMPRAGAGATATSTELLRSHFVARHRKRDRLRLVEVAIAYERDRNVGQLDLKILRRAADVPREPARWNTEGKGAVDCTTGKIVMWAISTVPRAERTARTCADPGRLYGRNGVVACARP